MESFSEKGFVRTLASQGKGLVGGVQSKPSAAGRAGWRGQHVHPLGKKDIPCFERIYIDYKCRGWGEVKAASLGTRTLSARGSLLFRVGGEQWPGKFICKQGAEEPTYSLGIIEEITMWKLVQSFNMHSGMLPVFCWFWPEVVN